tara:strand:+ start:181 stop:513 length:333 start_codon:yes stop_codon:yes gene_type:complete
MIYGKENDTVMFSDDIADSVQIEHPKNTTRLQINNDTFELETLKYKQNNIKTIKAFGNINAILSLMDQETFKVQLIVNNELKHEFSKNDVEELQIDNISTNCSIIINLRG